MANGQASGGGNKRVVLTVGTPDWDKRTGETGFGGRTGFSHISISLHPCSLCTMASPRDDKDYLRIHRVIYNLFKYYNDDHIIVEEYDGKLYIVDGRHGPATHVVIPLPSMSALEAFEAVVSGSVGIKLNKQVVGQLIEKFSLDTPVLPTTALRIATNRNLDIMILLGNDDALTKLTSKVLGTLERYTISDMVEWDFRPEEIVVLHPITSLELDGMKKTKQREERKRKYDAVMQTISEKVESGAITTKAAQYLEGCANYITPE